MERTSYNYHSLTSNGPLRSLVIVAGLEMEVFDHLSEPVSPADLAERIGFNPANLARFLNALAAIGLIEHQDGLYWNRPLTQFLLATASPTYLGDWFLFIHRLKVSGLEPVAASLKEGLRASAYPGKTRPPRTVGLQA
ncbi:MAG: hypothetical protein KKB20_28365 [Proteobacteria bacterium]|nr:hypothetical protein [Pseudomonadota bacterium]